MRVSRSASAVALLWAINFLRLSVIGSMSVEVSSPIVVVFWPMGCTWPCCWLVHSSFSCVWVGVGPVLVLLSGVWVVLHRLLLLCSLEVDVCCREVWEPGWSRLHRPGVHLLLLCCAGWCCCDCWKGAVVEAIVGAAVLSLLSGPLSGARGLLGV